MKIYTANQEEKCKDIDPTLKYKVLPAKMIVKDFIDGEESCNYEIYLRELINASSFFRSKSGGEEYLAPNSESNSEPDAITSQYFLDFKLLIAETRMRAKRELSPSINKYIDGFVGEGPSRQQGEQKVTNLCQAIRYLKKDDLYRLISQDSKNFIEKDIVRYLKTLRVKKNLILFLPMIFSYDYDIDEQEAISRIETAVYRDLQESMKYRYENVSEYDTFVTTIFNEKMIFYKLDKKDISYIESVELTKSNTYVKLDRCGSW